MATVKVNIMGISHNISCEEGQEERLKKLAADIDRKYETLGLKARRVPESLSWVIIAMTMADEIENLKTETANLKENQISGDENYITSDALITTINGLARQIYTVAESLKKE